jgi:hypothetical protein
MEPKNNGLIKETSTTESTESKCRFCGCCLQWAENVVDCRGIGFGCTQYAPEKDDKADGN